MKEEQKKLAVELIYSITQRLETMQKQIIDGRINEAQNAIIPIEIRLNLLKQLFE